MPERSEYVIIGNGVAGTTAAETIKEERPEAQVTILAGEPYPLYNRVALPRMLKSQIEPERVFMRSEDDHREKGIDLHLATLATSVDTDNRVVETHTGRAFPYDRLLIATGGTPRQLPAEGVEGTEGIYGFQSYDDTEALLDHIARADRAVTIGGSFIAYELTEGFQAQGLDTTWILRGTRFLKRILEDDGGRLVDTIARDHGVDVIYQDEVERVVSRGGVIRKVVTKEGREIECDMMGCGIGLNMSVDFLEGSGVEVETGVLTDRFLETNVPGVFAAGDVAEFYDVTLDQYNLMGTWDNARSHGRHVGRNMVGANEPYRDIPTYSSTLFDSTITAIGVTPETHPDVDGIHVLNEGERTYRRFFLKEGRLVGAALIGNLKIRRNIMKLIRSEEVVDRPEKLLDM